MAPIRTIALSLWKIASDVRLMGMGPRAGLGELALPETQPGSSIMPGKVNPVIVESLTMVVARVVGNDATIAFAQTGSLLELNVMLPVTADALLESITLLAAAADQLQRPLHRRADRDRARPAARRAGAHARDRARPRHRLRRGGDARQGGPQARAGRSASSRSSAAWTRPSWTACSIPAAMTEPGLGGGPAGG